MFHHRIATLRLVVYLAAVIGSSLLSEITTLQAQGALTNGGNHSGVIATSGETHEWSFSAEEGEFVVVAITETDDGTGFNPWIRILNSEGTEIGRRSGAVTTRVFVNIQQTGAYSVVVASSDPGNDGTGAYQLFLARGGTDFVVPDGDEGGAITNGIQHPGTIGVGDLDMWRFDASPGDRIFLSVGEVLDGETNTGFVPLFYLVGPDGKEITRGQGNLVGQINVVAAAAGRHTVVVFSGDSGGDDSGPYRLHLAQSPGSFTVSPGDEGGPLTDGANHEGTIELGDLDQWSFTAEEGETIVLSMGEVLESDNGSGFVPWLRLIGPDGALLGNDWGTVAQINTTAPATGTYTAVAGTNDGGQDATGDYLLHLANDPAQFIVPAGDEGGALANGERHTGRIHTGDLDQWSFEASESETLILSIGEITEGETDPGFIPWIRLIGPDGAQLASRWGNVVGQINETAPASGRYTVIVATNDSGNDATGAYTLHLARIPASFSVSAGDEGGAMTNGGNHPGSIDPGDLDLWSVTVDEGDFIAVSVGEVAESESAPGFTPWLRLLGPDGSQIGNDWGNLVAQVNVTAATAGTYTAVVGSNDGGMDGGGTYLLRLSTSAGDFVVPEADEGGVIGNGDRIPGTLELGDLELWSFDATEGDALLVSIGEVLDAEVDPGFVPWIRLIQPGGKVLGNRWGNAVAQVSETAPETGRYLIIVGTNDSGNDGFGNYELHFIKAPGEFIVAEGDEGGPLDNGGKHLGRIDTGDLDVWSIEAPEGARIIVSAVESFEAEPNSDFSPWIRLYGPDGMLLGNRWGSLVAIVEATASVGGVHTIVVGTNDSANDGNGEYLLHVGVAPGELKIAEDDEGGDFVNGTIHEGSIPIGDIDFWQFHSTPGDDITLRLNEVPFVEIDPGFVPNMILVGPDGGVIQRRSGTSEVEIKTTANQEGTFTVIVNTNDSGFDATADYRVQLIRYAPDLIVPDDAAVNEGDPLNVEIRSWDPLEPEKELTFELVSAPEGVALTPASNTTATISWPTSEVDGPGSHVIEARVIDVVENRTWIRTNRFEVVINEVNVAPSLATVQAQRIEEMQPLNLTIAATDVDLPPNPLTYRLVAGPEGMTVDSSTGALIWAPGETDGPGEFNVEIEVVDENVDAINEKQLSAQGSFTLIVEEQNRPPVFEPVPAQQAVEGMPFMLGLLANDPDLPANGLNYSLVTGPEGLIVDPRTGQLSWLPGEALGGTTAEVTVQVADDGVNPPMLDAVVSFSVVVEDTNEAPTIVTPAELIQFTESEANSLQLTATDIDLPADELSFSIIEGPEGLAIDSSGLLSWDIPDGVGGQSFEVTVRVADSGTPSMGSSETLTVEVLEKNLAPTLIVPLLTTITENETLTVQATATDGDVPADTLTFALTEAPTNATIDASTGEISWSPGEEHGGEQHMFTVSVTDDGLEALSDTGSFFVRVIEINAAPTISPIADVSTSSGTLLEINVEAADPDLPENTLSYSIVTGPEGLTIDETSGVITWTATEDLAGTQQEVTVQVQDDAIPVQSATASFQITVTGAAPILGIANNAGAITLTIQGPTDLSYEIEVSTDLETWSTIDTIQLTTSPFEYVDADASSESLRYYRVRVNQP